MRKEHKIEMIKDYRELVSLIMQSGDIMDHYVRQNSGGAFADPQRGQGRVMTLLRMTPEISQKELVYLLGISKQALGEVLSKLENCGYIERHPSESDKRVMMVKLTEKGKEAAEEMNQVKDRSAELFNCLNSEELDNLKDYLERIIASNLDLLPPRHRPPGPGYGPEGHRPPGPGPDGYGFDGYGEYGGRGEGHRPPGPGYGPEGHRPPGPGPDGYGPGGYGPGGYGPGGYGPDGYGFNGYGECGGRGEGHRPPGPGPEGHRPPGPGPEFNGYVEFGGRGGHRPPGPGPDGHRPPGPGPDGHRPPGPGPDGHRPPGEGPDGHRPPEW